MLNKSFESTNYLRKAFLDFFAKNQHTILASAPLIPHLDPSLLFVNSGMAPFKDYFTGLQTPPHLTVATSQKCVRAGGKHNDLQTVGYTARHHTFFEMLGNFSFGAYFKEQAITLAWNFLTQELKLSKERLYVTIYYTDDEAFSLWQKIAQLAEDKIIRIYTSDNFWQMGPTGPCGPCTEIFYDHGENITGGLPGSGIEGDRFVEIWNLVFMQYNLQENGEMLPLPHPAIDTGMGLERISAIMQNVHDNYEIDIFRRLINAIQNITKNTANKIAHKVIADHLRSAAFLIADGILPSNQGRGYVLRKIIRRATRYSHKIGYSFALLSQLFPFLKEEMGGHYPELDRAEEIIIKTLQIEEEDFLSIIDKGIAIIDSTVATLKENEVFSGKVAFRLYDTYGFPVETTIEILAEKGFTLDLDSFEKEMKQQQERSRAAWRGSGEVKTSEIWFNLLEKYGPTEFIGYEAIESCSTILAILENSQLVNQTNSTNNIYLLLDNTPFYGESGGQLGDKGLIYGENFSLEVIDTQKVLNKLIIHHCRIKHGLPKIGEKVNARIEIEIRAACKAAHSATHLLHYILRKKFGNSLIQKGSLVDQDRLRFDFTLERGISIEELREIELNVNKLVWQNYPVSTEVISTQEAVEKGAMALFGEKYDNLSRVVKMEGSTELCGGTHVKFTSEIGLFCIYKESAIAKGIRRIEAFTRDKALIFMYEKQSILEDKNKDLAKKLHASIQEQEKAFLLLHNNIAEYTPTEEFQTTNNIPVITKTLEGVPADNLRKIVLNYKAKAKNKIIVFFSKFEGKTIYTITVPDNLVSSMPANKLAEICKKIIGGTAGGKNNIAYGMANSFSQIPKAIEALCASS